MKLFRLIVTTVIISILFCGCSVNKGKSGHIQRSGFAFDTFITIDIYDSDKEEILNECFSLCEKYENLFSRTISTSEISAINNAEGKLVIVSDDTIELIEKGIYYGDLSGGVFDITIASASELWDFHEEGTIPDDQDIKEAIKHISYKNIVIDKDNNSVMLKDPETKIDLGGLAKGYIADRLKDYLISKEVTSALINLGGNIISVGNKPDGSPFRIGIKKPFSDSEIESTVELRGKAVSTSGVYERCFKRDDILYHHILDPKTGYPRETDLWGVSIVCDSSLDADALGTICILMGYEKAKEFMESVNTDEIIWSKANVF